MNIWQLILSTTGQAGQKERNYNVFSAFPNMILKISVETSWAASLHRRIVVKYSTGLRKKYLVHGYGKKDFDYGSIIRTTIWFGHESVQEFGWFYRHESTANIEVTFILNFIAEAKFGRKRCHFRIQSESAYKKNGKKKNKKTNIAFLFYFFYGSVKNDLRI